VTKGFLVSGALSVWGKAWHENEIFARKEEQKQMAQLEKPNRVVCIIYTS